MATETDAVFKELSATGAGINDVRAVVEAAKTTLALTGRYVFESFNLPIIDLATGKLSCSWMKVRPLTVL